MLDFLYYPIAFVLKAWHALWSTMLDPASGAAWVLSIMFLVFTLRILLFPIFVKMIKGQRAMQELQPEIAKLKEEFGKDRQAMSEAMMKLQKERGVNPLASCLPMLVQAPVFIALLHVLRRLGPDKVGLYSWNDALTQQAAVARVFGAPISSHFGSLFSGKFLGGTDNNAALIAALPGTTMTNIRWVTGVLIVVMCTTQFFSTRQLMKRSAASGQPAANGQMQMVQKLMLYGAPVMLLFSGTIFPLGVLVYWFVNNLWTIGQQFWVLKRMPPPGGTPALETLDFEVDPAKLAPRPGAKPQRNPAPRKSAIALADGDSSDSADDGDSLEDPLRLNDRPAKPTRGVGTPPAKPSSGKPVGKPKTNSPTKASIQPTSSAKADQRRRNKR